MLEITSYSVRNKTLSGLLKLVPKNERAIIRTKIKNYHRFSCVQFIIEEQFKWVKEKCNTYFELTPNGKTNQAKRESYLHFTNLAQDLNKSDL